MMSTLRENGSRAPGALIGSSLLLRMAMTSPNSGRHRPLGITGARKCTPLTKERRRLRRAHEDLDDASNTVAPSSSAAWEPEDQTEHQRAPSRLYRD